MRGLLAAANPLKVLRVQSGATVDHCGPAGVLAGHINQTSPSCTTRMPFRLVEEKGLPVYGMLHAVASVCMDAACSETRQRRIARPMPPQGLEAVLIAERDTLLRFLRARGAGDAAEDILQDLWLRLSSAQTGPINDPRGYLYRAANNVMHDRFRSAQRHRKRDGEWMSVHGGDTAASDTPLPDRRLIARAMLDRAEAALRDEGERVLEIFRLFRIEEMGQRAIAQHLGLSLSTVEKDLQKAYRTLMRLKDMQDAE